ncbi:hypothetical protein BurJ1DRAFT_1742 [Burkholderiales bacterium JOSHI_001]|nr:hypothetical protein BurJ1DRAFT_1742 [Burkholderiales bacterium JOSHI_001]
MNAPRLLQRFAALALASTVGWALAAPNQAADDPPPQPVQAPYYGDGLFHFFQGRYFTAITTLMVSQHFQRVAPHDDEAEVLRGGMLLSYGMHQEAGRIFTQLIEGRTSAAVRDRAWFFLAKIRHQRGLLPEAEAALAQVGNKLPPALDDDRHLLHAQLLLARQDYGGASQVLQALAARPQAGPYARFNLGVAQVRSGDSAGGSATLNALGQASAPNEELRSLRDKANLALGFAALQAGQPEQARGHLERVRLQGAQANKALLGFGWAAASLKEPQQALVPWLELLQRDPSDSAVLEARIAVPYAYAEAGATRQAIDGYQQAITQYEQEAGQLDATLAAVRAGKLLQALAERNPEPEMGWLQGLADLPDLPHPSHLGPVLAQHDFQEAFKGWRDLQFLDANLKGWGDKLGVFQDMLDHRARFYAERLPALQARARSTGTQSLGTQAQGLHGELAQAEQAGDGLALATEAQRAMLTKLKAMRGSLDRLGDLPDLAGARERHRLAEGALTWDLARQEDARRWQATKALTQIDQGLAEAQDRETRVAQAQKDEPARFEQFARRLAALSQRVAALQPRVAALQTEQQQAAQDIAVAGLAGQQDRLGTYGTQARFALAQLMDRAHLAQQSTPQDDHAQSR